MSEHKIPERWKLTFQELSEKSVWLCPESELVRCIKQLGQAEHELAALQERNGELERALNTKWEKAIREELESYPHENPPLQSVAISVVISKIAARVAALDSTQASTPQENAETFPPCKHCRHEGLSHDEEFGNCSECDCPGYEELQPSTPKEAQ